MSNQPWFFAPPSGWTGSVVTLPPEESHHALKVVRVAPPDVITIFDGRGRVARCAISNGDGVGVRAEILESSDQPRPMPRIAVYQGAAKSGKLDDVVERLAELGVAEMWAFDSERAVAKWDER
ncbi:MAG: RsmE family RNA methyltransferase, partial [Actinomycetota bacterium]